MYLQQDLHLVCEYPGHVEVSICVAALERRTWEAGLFYTRWHRFKKVKAESKVIGNPESSVSSGKRAFQLNTHPALHPPPPAPVPQWRLKHSYLLHLTHLPNDQSKRQFMREKILSHICCKQRWQKWAAFINLKKSQQKADSNIIFKSVDWKYWSR